MGARRLGKRLIMQGTDDGRRVALITGASGGIGADLARVFARNGHDLMLVARSDDKLAALADEIERATSRRPLRLALDLSDPKAADAIEAALQQNGARVKILVNNAGYGLSGDVGELGEAEQLGVIDLNVRALTQLTIRFLPDIRAAGGKILNVASVASYFPGGPGMAIYYASKAYVLSFSLGLAQELLQDGVTVSALCPGMTPTGFQARAKFGPDIKLDKIPATSSMEVAEAGYKGLMAGRREIIPGGFNKLGAWVLPFAPKHMILSLISQMQHQRR